MWAAAASVITLALSTPIAIGASLPRDVRVTDFGADPSGQRDSRAAIAAAIAAAHRRRLRVLFPSGTYRVLATTTSPFLLIPPDLHLRGEGAVLRLESNGAGEYCELFRTSGNAHLEGLTLTAAFDVPSVLINVAPSGRAFFVNCKFLGGKTRRRADAYCHGVQMGAFGGVTASICLINCTSSGLSNSFLMTNSSTGRILLLKVVSSQMQNVDVNSPRGRVDRVEVLDCIIDGRYAVDFTLSLANVRSALIARTKVRRARIEGLHIEDYSSNVLVDNCYFERCGEKDPSAGAYVQLIGGTHDVEIRNCKFDATKDVTYSTRRFVNIQAGGGVLTGSGRKNRSPFDVRLLGNKFTAPPRLGRDGIYAEGVTDLDVVGNSFTGDYGSEARSGTLLILNEASIKFEQNIVKGWASVVQPSSKPFVRGQIIALSNKNTYMNVGHL